MENRVNVLHEIPSSQEYIALRLTAGLSSKDDSAVQTALGRSILSVAVRNENSELIGMGRMIGDGGCYVQIVDVIVNPAHQDHEIGDIIMRELLEYADKNVPKDADVTLITDLPQIAFYQKYGFKLIYPELYGMSRKR
ncbi:MULTISPECIES: GNAT family N-acetyltransferase [unclassified Paenibacillus]|uniref:GNAT family N-acetyltransferase n=1 Tax=unclassified Paenibacillus TaxID=185978 RepID=UPI001E3BEB55|nr:MULTISPECIES: GNAT family N-acetyltransferase [unclassified Paenibacillus]CAH0121317.1 hypothetical protein PAE9249_03844 [Paenibacillus sp. CECT 9249]